ncbi:hypothetical protein I545_6514, partial [Mycobacterium kansasii 662]
MAPLPISGTPGQCLDGLVNHIEHILLQGVQRVGAWAERVFR